MQGPPLPPRHTEFITSSISISYCFFTKSIIKEQVRQKIFFPTFAQISELAPAKNTSKNHPVSNQGSRLTALQHLSQFTNLYRIVKLIECFWEWSVSTQCVFQIKFPHLSCKAVLTNIFNLTLTFIFNVFPCHLKRRWGIIKPSLNFLVSQIWPLTGGP